jgi:class 3 adenylate cyclase/CHAT domain-containing protein/Flp pilus assembly protein TadD
VEEDKTKIDGFYAHTIEEVMRERQRLDRILQEKFTKRMAILFSDVCGFTQYMETRGDISGRAWIQQHHDLVFPCIEGNEGKILDVLGDGVMASFPSSGTAVSAAAAIQRTLDAHNARTDPVDHIHVKIGINAGEILMDDRNVAGDVVNVASRIQAQAEADEVLVSKAVYEDVRSSDDVLCRFYRAVQVKGKAKPLDLYRVVWREDEMVVATESTVRGADATPQKKTRTPPRVLQLEVAWERDRLKISAHEYLAGEATTIRHYEETPVSMDLVGRRCRETVELLNRANRFGRLTREILIKLREVGQVFYDEFFTMGVKQKLRDTKVEYLRLYLDDHLVHIPWELFYDGQQFLCQRFNMGRLVRTRQAVVGTRRRALAYPLKMLIIADPEGDLKGAYREGTQLRDDMDHYQDLINVSLRSGSVTPEFLREKIRNFDLVHYAGHADYNPDCPGESGWRLTSGTLKPQEIVKMAGTAAMPALIVSNACQSARTEEWSIRDDFQGEIFGLANAFLLAGVRHYIGTFWEILDQPSSHFSLEFYKNLLSGLGIGEAMRLARQALIREYGEETIVWASYILYGDPTFSYLAQVEAAKEEGEPRRVHTSVAGAEVRAREEVIDLAEKGVTRRRRTWWAAAAGVIVALAVLLGGYRFLSNREIARYEKEALASYSEGNFDQALSACRVLEEKRPKGRLARLIEGNIYLRKGNLEQAEAAFQGALQAGDGTNAQKAEAYIGLGRIASLRKQPEESLNYYRQATEAAPEGAQGYISQAALLEGQGDYGGALALLLKAQKLAPEDRTVAALTRNMRERAAFIQDQERQARVDQAVKELLERMKAPPRALPSDGWTSSPLTLWVMDFETQGFPLREGEERLLVSGIVDQVLGKSRVQVVERGILDKLLRELKLGTSDLTERSTALNVGRILAARLIVSGQVVYAGPLAQVSMRLIETETGRITATVNESFGSAVPASEVADRLGEKLLEKLGGLYPLRGKVSAVSAQGVKLNIGQRVGVATGQLFKVVNEDITLTVTAVQADTSLAAISKGGGPLSEGLRLEALPAPASRASES